jgi:hypothetical protein
MGKRGPDPSFPEDRELVAARRNVDHVRALGAELNRRFGGYAPPQAPYSEHGQHLLEELIRGGPLCVGCAAEQLGANKTDALKSVCQLISLGWVLCDHAACRRCSRTQLVARLRR